MECRDIPATNESYCNLAIILRNQIMAAMKREGVNAKPDVIESTLDTILPESIVESFNVWFPQKPKLEAILIPYFLDIIVRINMEPERGNHRYQYAIATEGRCLQRHKKSNSNPFGFVKRDPIAEPNEQYTLDELIKNWREIFVLDEAIEGSKTLRDRYAPECNEHGVAAIPALILTTQHQLRIVGRSGDYVKGTNISYCRTKSGPGHIIKMAEYLTGLIANGGERESIDDYLAALSREPDPEKTWVKAMRTTLEVGRRAHSDLYNIVRLKGYTSEEADALKKSLKNDPEVGGFVSGRPDLEFIAESLPEHMKDRKFGELWFPCNGNKICWQVYRDEDYKKIEGDKETKHIEYKTKKERQMLEGFTAWHWSIMRKLAPYFVDKYMLEAFNRIYEPYLTLKHFKP